MMEIDKTNYYSIALVTISLVLLFSIAFQGDAHAVSKTINAEGAAEIGINSFLKIRVLMQVKA